MLTQLLYGWSEESWLVAAQAEEGGPSETGKTLSFKVR